MNDEEEEAWIETYYEAEPPVLGTAVEEAIQKNWETAE